MVDHTNETFINDVRVFRKVFPGTPSRSRDGKTILILDRGSTGYIRYEIYLYRVLQMLGYKLVCVGWRLPDVVRYYDLLGIPFHYWEEFVTYSDTIDIKRQIAALRSDPDIKSVEIGGVRVGVHALAECLRTAYLNGDRRVLADLSARRPEIEEFLARGIHAIDGVSDILERFRPDYVFFGDGLYTLQGTFLDVVLNRGIAAIKIHPALEDDALYLKRCSFENRNWPYTALSASTWKRMLTLEWGDDLKKSFHNRHLRRYRNGEWFSHQALTKNTQIYSAQEIRQQLNLDPSKKLAVLFPHLIWDTPVYGRNLFPDHGAWLVAVVRAALQNEQVDWIIKVHPANVFSTQNEDFRASSDFAEIALLKSAVGPLRAHVRILMPDTNITTHSLLQLADYCLTETGTVGIEAAAMGVTSLTAGASHYSHLGFTVDSNSQEQLVERVRTLHEILPISDEQQSLAERFAYAAFYVKPLRLTSMRVRFPNATNSGINVEPLVTDGGRFVCGSDMTAFVEWLETSGDDYFSEELLRA